MFFLFWYLLEQEKGCYRKVIFESIARLDVIKLILDYDEIDLLKNILYSINTDFIRNSHRLHEQTLE